MFKAPLKKHILFRFLFALFFAICALSSVVSKHNSAYARREEVNAFKSSADSLKHALEQEEDDKDNENYDPSDYELWKKTFKPVPIKNMIYSKSKKGCAQKMRVTALMVKAKKQGKDLGALAEEPILGSYATEQYEAIAKKTMVQAQKDMMKDYHTCLKESPESPDPGREYDLNFRYGGCARLNKILMATVQGIQKGQSIDSVIDRYQKKFPDLSKTMYKKINDPVLFFIGGLYEAAQETEGSSKDKYEAMLGYVSDITVGCTL